MMLQIAAKKKIKDDLGIAAKEIKDDVRLVVKKVKDNVWIAAKISKMTYKLRPKYEK